MATASNDGTCKVWIISSYQKDITHVRSILKHNEELNQRYINYIDVLDEEYDPQFDMKHPQMLKMGELEISPGYHADLKFTCVHEGPVSTCAFTSNSDILVTGSADCTCRVWSTKKGDQLFQINLPDGVTMMTLDYNDTLYLYCGSRLLQFQIESPSKEKGVPQFWKPSTENQKATSQIRELVKEEIFDGERKEFPPSEQLEQSNFI